jgi:ABC-type transporter MlaC component
LLQIASCNLIESDPESFLAQRRHIHMRLAALRALVVFASLSTALGGTARACDADGFVSNAGQAFMGAARSGSAAAFTGAASRYADLHAIAIFALGPNRAKMPKGREKLYVSLTRNFIGRVLAKNSGRFRGSSLSVEGCTGSPTALTVTTRLSGGQRVVFKLYKTRSGYRVRDVSVSSIWLAQQLRTTFTGVVNRNGGNIDALFAYLGG